MMHTLACSCSSAKLSKASRASSPSRGTGSLSANLAIHPSVRRSTHSSAACKAAKQDGSVIDRPVISPNKSLKDAGAKQKPPMYRVLLHNDSLNRREYVVSTLLKVVDGMPVDEAVNIMQKAHIDGVALVLVCAQEDAENYVSSLRKNGLTSTLEPHSGSGKPDSNDN